MTRSTALAALTALAIVLPLRADDKVPPTPPKPGLKTKFAEIIKEFQEEFGKKAAGVKTPEEQEALMAKIHEVGGPFGEKALKLAQEDLKDPAALEILSFAIIVGRNEKAAGVIAASLMDNPNLPAGTLELAANAPDNPAVEALLKDLATRGANKKLQGHAIFAVAQMQLAQAEKATDPKKSEALMKEAEGYAVTVTKDFAAIQGPDDLLGEAAKKFLFQLRNLSVGRPAPEVISKDLEDKEAKLSAYKGKVVVLDIWATWCGPCKAMIPHEREMVAKLKGKPFALISVSADDKKEALTKFLETEKMPWTHWWEGGKEDGMLKTWNVQFFPTIYVIDAKGVIRYKNVRGKKLEEAVEKLVKEAEEKK